jgi:hypothetical protein
LTIDIVEVGSALVAETTVRASLSKDTVRKTSVGNAKETINCWNVTSVATSADVLIDYLGQVISDTVVDESSGGWETTSVIVNIRTQNTNSWSPRIGRSLNPSR